MACSKKGDDPRNAKVYSGCALVGATHKEALFRSATLEVAGARRQSQVEGSLEIRRVTYGHTSRLHAALDSASNRTYTRL